MKKQQLYFKDEKVKERNLNFIGYPNYTINENGMVYSLYKGEKKVLLQSHIPKHYAYVWLYNNGDKKRFLVHRLVAMAFIPNPNNYPIVNHKDENPANNCANNLEWCSYAYNRNYGSANRKLSEINTNGVLSKCVLQYNMRGDFIKEYPSTKEVQRVLGIACSSVSECCRGIKNKKHAGGYIWRYKEDNKRVIPQKGIIQMTKEGTQIGWYSGISEASRFTGISYGALQKCLYGYSKTAGGYKWEKEI